MQELAQKEEQTEVPIHSKEEENKEDYKMMIIQSKGNLK